MEKTTEQYQIELNQLLLQRAQEKAAERIRIGVLSMGSSDDLLKVISIMFRELLSLGVQTPGCGVFFVDEERALIRGYLAMENPGKHGISWTSSELWEMDEETSVGVWVAPLEEDWDLELRCWRSGEIRVENRTAEEDENEMQALHEMFGLQRPLPWIKDGGPVAHVPFQHGWVSVRYMAFAKEDTALLQELTEALSLGYVRFLDIEHLEEQNRTLEQTLKQIREMQNQLVMQEKMASLGALTAGIAHEIRNPLNFVNNFAELSENLTRELLQELQTQKEKMDPEVLEEIEFILSDLEQNVQKINEHGKRADSIVQGMLLHSRGQAGERTQTDLNALLAENINLAYHGMRAQDTSFNVAIETDYDDSLGLVETVPQDMSRVFLNVINNAFYALYEKEKSAPEGFSSMLSVATKALEERVKISIKDNGPGMSPAVLEKIFEPFFTTKPSGSGTGLGLSLSYDMVVQEHHGKIEVETKEGDYTEFTIFLPKKPS